jgi:uncharacterized YigZ family protein
MLFDDTYRTIEKRAEGLYRDRGSKFIAIALPVRNEVEVKSYLGNIRAEYHDARHHCYAYMLGADKSAYRFNDDGEPSGTAGRPILGQINSNDLTNVLVVVVRYFGGTKLGVRGLINAYKSSASEALAASNIIEKTVDEIYVVRFEYPAMNQVMQIMKEPEVSILSQDFALHCKLEFMIRRNLAESICSRLSTIGSVEVSFLKMA